jgi:hypothetical protein
MARKADKHGRQKRGKRSEVMILVPMCCNLNPSHAYE